MYPIYKFELAVNGVTRRVYPLYSGDLSKEYDLESGQQFFRQSLNGDLEFVSEDFDYIVAMPIDTQFDVTIYISFDAGSSWEVTWRGQFWKTDCKFDEDDKKATVSPELRDVYTELLNGWEKEFNLIDLAPEIVNVKIDKRPMIQIYVPGQTVIGCFLSGMGWEQECEAVSNVNTLRDTYHFALARTIRSATVTQQGSPVIPDVYAGTAPVAQSTPYTYANGDYAFRYLTTYDGENTHHLWQVIRYRDSLVMWQYDSTEGPGPGPINMSLTLSPVNGSGTVKIDLRDTPIMARYVCDVDSIDGENTYALPSEDIVPDNRNYHRVLGYDTSDGIYYSPWLSDTPTPYGIYQPGLYYDLPSGVWGPDDVFPIAKSAWGRLSFWFTFSDMDWQTERSARSPFVLKDAYPLASVISVLLNKIAPDITHEANINYSRFLYGVNPISGVQTTPVITPKSNLIYSGYDQPAQRAPITLRQVLDMLRDCFRCYWYVDSANRLRIEHIVYFNNGLSYSDQTIIGIDLTSEGVSRNDKKWDYAKNKYEYDKPEMAARYQFGWMDDQTLLFDGYPIDILSKFVQANKIENIDVQNFSSDVDYILLNPSAISKDGFVLMLCQDDSIPTQVWVELGGTSDEMSGGEILDVMDVSSYVGKNMRIWLTANITAGLYGSISDANGNVLEIIGSIFPDDESAFWEFTVPSGGVWLTVSSAEYFSFDMSSIQYLSSGSPQQMLGLPYVNIVINAEPHYLQNGYASFVYLQRFYFYDLPASSYEINGIVGTALGVKKAKTQEVQYPQYYEPNLQHLIKTNLGDGKIRKMSLNLSSRSAKATLEYDTE